MAFLLSMMWVTVPLGVFLCCVVLCCTFLDLAFYFDGLLSSWKSNNVVVL